MVTTRAKALGGCGCGARVAGGRRRAALTLVELLVAVSVIALLAAVLAPSLARGKAAAWRVRCVGNLRQLGLAAQMYWDDSGGQAFRYYRGATNGGDWYWFGWLGRGSEGARRFDPARGALHPYVAGCGIRVCPSLRYHDRSFKPKAFGAAYGYGYNLALSAPLSQAPVRLPASARLTDLVLLADSAQINTFQPPASPERPMLEEFYYVNDREPTVHFRHNGEANAVFCDGHVGAERAAPGSLDPRLPTERVGRLRPEILNP